MNKEEKNKYHYQTIDYLKSKKVEELFDHLIQKLLVFQPDDVFGFLIENISHHKNDQTFLFFGESDILDDTIKNLLSREKNIVYYDYSKIKDYDLLKDLI